MTRQPALLEKGFISPDALDIVEQQLETARAQLTVGEAQLARDRTNLNYSVIRSPISGVVIARNVDIGQTVAASFQTPTLFQIAKDLSQMQIDTVWPRRLSANYIAARGCTSPWTLSPSASSRHSGTGLPQSYHSAECGVV